MQLAKRFSAITEQSAEGAHGPQKRGAEIEFMRELAETLVVLEEATEDTPGSFQLKLVPNCGEEEPGCSIELRVQYREEYPDADYDLVEDTADGLTAEQLAGLQGELECLLGGEVESAYDVITGLQDYLGCLNPHTKRVI